MIVLIQKFLGYNHLILALVRKGLYLCHINVTVDVDALRLLCKNNRNMKMACYDTGDADAGSLDGENFVDRLALKTALKFLAHLVEQINIHLMVEKAVYLQNVSFLNDTVFYDTLL